MEIEAVLLPGTSDKEDTMAETGENKINVPHITGKATPSMKSPDNIIMEIEAVLLPGIEDKEDTVVETGECNTRIITDITDKVPLLNAEYDNTGAVKRLQTSPSSTIPSGSASSTVTCEKCQDMVKLIQHFTKNKSFDTSKEEYRCDVCNRSFNGNHAFIKRRITHCEKPYSCDVCNRFFITKHNLIEHKRNHTGQKPFTCHICNSSFSHIYKYSSHMRTHSGQKQHNQSLSMNYSLPKHMKVHNRVMLHVCDICNNSFSRKENLYFHKRFHIGEKDRNI